MWKQIYEALTEALRIATFQSRNEGIENSCRRERAPHLR
jgi:hypothetical protein